MFVCWGFNDASRYGLTAWKNSTGILTKHIYCHIVIVAGQVSIAVINQLSFSILFIVVVVVFVSHNTLHGKQSCTSGFTKEHVQTLLRSEPVALE